MRDNRKPTAESGLSTKAVLSLLVIAAGVAAAAFLYNGAEEDPPPTSNAVEAPVEATPATKPAPVEIAAPTAAIAEPNDMTPEAPERVHGTGPIALPPKPGPAPWQTRISGRVQSADGSPLGHVPVTLFSSAAGIQVPLASATTDFGGEFVFDDPHLVVSDADEQVFAVAARLPGLAPSSARARITPSAVAARVTLTLEPGEAFAGQVLWEDDGKPVSNAHLLFLQDAVVGEATADGLGQFRAENLPKGSIYVAVAPPGGPHQFGGAGHSVPNEEARIDLVRPDGTVRGHVRRASSGEPQPDVVVTMGDWIIGYAQWRTQTDAQGNFEFTGIPREGWTIRLTEYPQVSAPFSFEGAPPAEVTILIPDPDS